jgi:hypothetical protein
MHIQPSKHRPRQREPSPNRRYLLHPVVAEIIAHEASPPATPVPAKGPGQAKGLGKTEGEGNSPEAVAHRVSGRGFRDKQCRRMIN